MLVARALDGILKTPITGLTNMERPRRFITARVAYISGLKP